MNWSRASTVLQAEASAIFEGGRGGIKGEGGLKGKYLWQGGPFGSQATHQKWKTGQVLKQFDVLPNGTDVSTLAVVERKCVSSEEICLLTVRQQLSCQGQLDIPKRAISTVL